VPCGDTGWAASNRELGAGCQAVRCLGRHGDNNVGRKTFHDGCPNWSLSALITCLAGSAQAMASVPGSPPERMQYQPCYLLSKADCAGLKAQGTEVLKVAKDGPWWGARTAEWMWQG